MDPENEDKLIAAFNALTENKTVIMIAHRLSTVVSADRIIVLDDGKIIEEGSHEQLLNRKGKYATMWADYNEAVSWRIKSQKEVH